MSLLPDLFVKMTPLDGSAMIESTGFCENTKRLYVKLRGPGAPILCYNGVPRFRVSGLQAAARKDEYFKNFIRSTYMSREVKELPGQPG